MLLPGFPAWGNRGQLAVIVCLSLTFMVHAQEGKPPEVAAYPESADGLLQLLHDLRDAARTNDRDKFSAIARDLVIPQHAAWFARNFGPEEGESLVREYEKLLPGFEERLRKSLLEALKEGRPEFKIERREDAQGLNERTVTYALFRAAREPLVLYDASTVKPDQQGAWVFADFFYVEGGFRFLPGTFFYSLTNFTPRLYVGGNVQQARLTYQPAPHYPAGAKEQGITGTVRLEVVIGTDGTVRELKVIAGAPALVGAAVEAVRQWRYKTTLLNGRPVEVVSTIDVMFRLHN